MSEIWFRTGEATVLRDWWKARVGNPEAVEIDDEVRALTS